MSAPRPTATPSNPRSRLPSGLRVTATINGEGITSRPVTSTPRGNRSTLTLHQERRRDITHHQGRTPQASRAPPRRHMPSNLQVTAPATTRDRSNLPLFPFGLQNTTAAYQRGLSKINPHGLGVNSIPTDYSNPYWIRPSPWGPGKV